MERIAIITQLVAARIASGDVNLDHITLHTMLAAGNVANMILEEDEKYHYPNGKPVNPLGRMP